MERGLVTIKTTHGSKVSIVIPSRNEEFLAKTVDDIFAKATGEIEVIVVLDGPTAFPLPAERPNLKLIKKPVAQGHKPSTNAGARVATGKFLMKTDAHCMFGKGFDEILKADCEDDWVTTVRRFTLDPGLWQPRPHIGVDYYYIACPWTQRAFRLKIAQWKSKTVHSRHIPIDDQMAIHGSMYLMTLDHFRNRIHGLDEERFGFWAGEPQDIGTKTWLGGGRVIINKKTWYAHLQLKPFKKGYAFPLKEAIRGQALVAQYWTTNKWEDRIHDFDWLIEKFWRLPRWPENWREFYEAGLA